MTRTIGIEIIGMGWMGGLHRRVRGPANGGRRSR